MTPLNEDQVLELFPDAAFNGKDWSAKCPAHDDERPSLSISFGEDGKALVHCHAGCRNGDVAVALGLKSEGALYDALSGAPTDEVTEKELLRHVKRNHNYHDATRRWVYTNVRYEHRGKKTFRLFVPDDDGPGGRWTLSGVRRVLYRLHRLLRQLVVFIVEGEKVVDSLNERGMCATTAVGGARGWHSKHAYGRQLADAGVQEVIILPDNDEPGRGYAAAAAIDCYSVGLKVKIVELPGLASGEDAYDFFQKGGTEEALLQLVKDAPPWTPSTPGTIVNWDFDQQLDALAEPADQIALLNTRHYTIKLGNQMVVGDERPGETPSFLPYSQFTHRYRHLLVLLPSNRFVPLGKYYLDSRRHRHFDGRLVCKPPGVAEPARAHDKNLWLGLAVEPKPGDWSLFHNHIRENICGAVPAIYEYLLNWLALLVQLPGRLPGTAICLRGLQGTGKTIFMKLVERIFHAESVATVTKPDLLVGRFNSILSAKVLVLADEAFFAGDPTSRGRLQALITDRTNVIERKGFEPVIEDNCCHLLIASNEDWIISVNDNDRRFLVLDVSAAHMQDLPYFDAIRRQQEDDGGTAAMLHDLLARDVTGFNPMVLPWTAAKQDQLTRSRKGFDAWWHHVLTEATPETWHEQPVKRSLYQNYLIYAETTKDRHPQGPELLSKFLIKYYGPRIIGRQRTNGTVKHIYLLPPLDEARQRFDKHEEWPKQPSTAAAALTIRRPRRRR